MKRAARKDKRLVIDILALQFSQVPGTTWMLRKNKHLNRNIRLLTSVAFEVSYCRQGVFIASNDEGIALCFKHNLKVFSLREVLVKLWFTTTAVKWSKFLKMLKLEKFKRSVRPKSGNYLYFWFFAVLKGGKDAGFELKNEIFAMAKKQNLPIYAETSLPRNKAVYERYGFHTYSYWEDKKDQLKIWFMCYEP